MVAGLVAVDVLADQAGDVLGVAVVDLRIVEVEHGVQLLDRRGVAAQRLDDPAQILRREPRVLPGVALGIVRTIVDGGRVEGLAIGPVRLTRPQEAGLHIEAVAPVGRPLLEGLGQVGLAHVLGHLGDGPVVIGVFDGLGGGFRLLVDRGVAQLHVVAETAIGGVGRALDHGVQGRLAIIAADALHPGVGDDRHGVIADHRPGLLAVELPDRQDAVRALLLRGDQRVDHVVGVVSRLDKGQQRMLGPEGVPQREGRVEGKRPAVQLALMHLVVGTPIAAIGVGIDARGQQGVVERRVEGLIHRGRGLDVDGAQGLLPGGLGAGALGVEVEARLVAGQVGDRPVLAGGRQRHLHGQRPVDLAKVEHPHEATALNLGAVVGRAARLSEAVIGDVLLGIPERLADQRAIELDGEEQLAPRSPAARLAIAGDHAVGRHPQARPQHLARIVVDRGPQVDQHLGAVALREGVAVQAGAQARRQLGAHAAVAQGDGVVARLGDLGVVAVARAVARARLVGFARLQLGLARNRGQQDVAEVGVAGAREVGVREAQDRRVAEAIAGGAGIALLEGQDVGVGAQLHHAERHDRAGEGVAVTARSDEGIDGVVGRCGLGQDGRRRQKGKAGEQGEARDETLAHSGRLRNLSGGHPIG